jgi:nicotinamide phosphoribosyltransferase
MKNINPLLMTDGYKTSHKKMYPEGTTLVYSNYTCRNTKYMPEGAKDIVVFGVQYMIKYIHELFDYHFFKNDKNLVINQAKKYLSSYLGTDYDVSHFEELYDLGYLPIEIKALKEGSIIKAGIPLFTIKNTDPRFFWVTNYLETLLSTLIWKPVHSASLAYAYKKVLLKYASATDKENLGFVDFQGHDFSFRGMQSPESAIASAMGFLTSFKGTDTIPALEAMEYYYNSKDVAFSVPASEHSVMCAHGKEGEIETLRYLMNQYPAGIVSIVSDTWDLWKLVTEYLPILKDEILRRDGKLVIRPDSGNPVDIICGCLETSVADQNHPKNKGVIELLWDVFGGTINDQGYKVLDSHIGAIYGDSITLERAEEICKRLQAKGFASTNIVLGIGSYSMGYATRDNQGGAVKSTYVEVNGQAREIFKDPITDDGTKKSAKGLLHVYKDGEEFKLVDQVQWFPYEDGLPISEATGKLGTVYKNGNLTNSTTLEQVRKTINNSICLEPSL